MTNLDETSEPNPGKQPIFNIPGVILGLVGAFVVIHLIKEYALSQHEILLLLWDFAFIPARFAAEFKPLFSPVTYSFLHGDWAHLAINSIWLLAFGSVLARRLGIFRFLLFCVMGSLLGAAAHFLSHQTSIIPMIGASAIVSACMGAAVRFAFPENGRFSPQVHNLPKLSFLQTLRNRQAMVFTVVWFAINFIFGISGELVAGEGQSIAWQAHIGGFLSGFLLFGWIDPAKNIR